MDCMHGPVTKNLSAAKIGLAGPILAAKTGSPCHFGSPCENVNSKQSKVARYCRIISYFANVSKVPFLLDAFT